MSMGLSMSCDQDDDSEEDLCITDQIAYVTSVESPDTGNVNDSITIEVKFSVANGCGDLGQFIETGTGNTRIIEVEARYQGCICTQEAPIRTANYMFTASTAGNYELKFKSSPTEFITVDLVIN